MAGHLGHHAGHGGQAVNAVRGESLQIGLNPRAGGVVGTGDRERDGWRGRRHQRRIDKAGCRGFRVMAGLGEPGACMMNGQQQGVYLPTARVLQESAGLSASVDRVEFAPSLHAPTDRPFPFGYAMTIRNLSPRAVTIKARKWVVKDLAAGTLPRHRGRRRGGMLPAAGTGRSPSATRVTTWSRRTAWRKARILACDDAGRALLVRMPPFLMKVNV